jgi:hypothetical protein
MANKPVERKAPPAKAERIHPIGRKPKSPTKRIGIPVRCMVTYPIYEIIEKVGTEMDISMSNTLRLALYFYLKEKGYDVRTDPSFNDLRARGLI